MDTNTWLYSTSHTSSRLWKHYKKKTIYTPILAIKKLVANCDQNNHLIRFWLLNNYKMKIMIEFSDQLSQDN